MELDCKDNILMGENNVFNKLVVMDYISGLAEKSDHFANFLTVSCKFYFPVYVFHMIYPTRSNWQMILSRKKFSTYFLALYRPFP